MPAQLMVQQSRDGQRVRTSVVRDNRASYVSVNTTPERRSRPPPRNEISCVIKYLVFSFNVIFWLIGGCCIAVGLWAWSEKQVLQNLGKVARMKFMDPVLLLLIAGGLMFSIGFCGCIGALRENRCWLLLYSVTIGIILFLQLTAGVLLFLFKDWFIVQIESELVTLIKNYREDADLESLIDWVQSDWLQCCGVTTPDDWDENKYFACDSNAMQKCGVPHSCCINSREMLSQMAEPVTSEGEKMIHNYQCGYGVRRGKDDPRTASGLPPPTADIHTMGCVPQGKLWVQNNIIPVAGVAVAMALIQIFSICLAQSLRTDVSAQIRQWQYQ